MNNGNLVMYVTMVDAIAFICVFVSALMDLYDQKIRNRWLILMLFTGILCRYVKEGRSSVLDMTGGLLLPFLFLFLLFFFHMIGAGDIKLLCVLGSMLGTEGIKRILLGTLWIGGVFSVFLLWKRKNMKTRLMYFYTYMQDYLRTGERKPYCRWGEKTKEERMPLAVPVLCSVCLYLGGWL